MSFEQSIENVASALNNIALGLNAIASAISGNGPVMAPSASGGAGKQDAPTGRGRSAKNSETSSAATAPADTPRTAEAAGAGAQEEKGKNSESTSGLPDDFEFERDLSKPIVALAAAIRAQVVEKLAEFGAKRASDVKDKPEAVLALYEWVQEQYANPEVKAKLGADKK